MSSKLDKLRVHLQKNRADSAHRTTIIKKLKKALAYSIYTVYRGEYKKVKQLVNDETVYSKPAMLTFVTSKVSIKFYNYDQTFNWSDTIQLEESLPLYDELSALLTLKFEADYALSENMACINFSFNRAIDVEEAVLSLPSIVTTVVPSEIRQTILDTAKIRGLTDANLSEDLLTLKGILEHGLVIQSLTQKNINLIPGDTNDTGTNLKM